MNWSDKMFSELLELRRRLREKNGGMTPAPFVLRLRRAYAYLLDRKYNRWKWRPSGRPPREPPPQR